MFFLLELTVHSSVKLKWEKIWMRALCHDIVCDHDLVKAWSGNYRWMPDLHTPSPHVKHRHTNTQKSVWVPGQDFIWNLFPNTTQQVIWTEFWLRRVKNGLQRNTHEKKERKWFQVPMTYRCMSWCQLHDAEVHPPPASVPLHAFILSTLTGKQPTDPAVSGSVGGQITRTQETEINTD